MNHSNYDYRSAILNAAASGALAENDKSQITPKSHLNSNIVNTTLNNNSIPSIMQNKNIVQRVNYQNRNTNY